MLCVLVAQSCLTPCNPGDCSFPGFSVHGISQTRILEWVAISYSMGSSQPTGSNLCLSHCRQIYFLPSEIPGKPLQCYTQKQINVTFYLHAYTYTKLLGEI